MQELKVALLPGSRGKYGLIAAREESLESLIRSIRRVRGNLCVRGHNCITRP